MKILQAMRRSGRSARSGGDRSAVTAGTEVLSYQPDHPVEKGRTGCRIGIRQRRRPLIRCSFRTGRSNLAEAFLDRRRSSTCGDPKFVRITEVP
jgi:hypothetical protein